MVGYFKDVHVAQHTRESVSFRYERLKLFQPGSQADGEWFRGRAQESPNLILEETQLLQFVGFESSGFFTSSVSLQYCEDYVLGLTQDYVPILRNWPSPQLRFSLC